MKKIVAFLLVAILLLSFSVGSYAEIVVDSDWVTDLLFDYVIGSNSTAGSVGSIPEFTNTNNSSIAFYISGTGKANVMYTILLKSSNAESATAEIYMEKHLIGPFWQRLNMQWNDTFTERYHVQSFNADVEDSGLYRVTMNVTVGKDNFKTTASFEYEKGILLGDVNSDNKITASDARTVLRYSAKLEKYSLNTEKMGDVNRDESITSADARLILKISSMNL